MSSAELQPHELMQLVASFFESHHIAYRVVGSMASMAYGEPRFTNDVDIVAELKVEHLAPLCAAFAAPDFYVSEQAVREAVTRRSQFNIVHPASGLKADVIVPPDTDFARAEAGRVRRITSAGEYSVWFGSPEDVILYKLVYYRLSGGQSDKHLRDIAGMIKLQGRQLDRDYISDWGHKLGVAAEWATAVERGEIMVALAPAKLPALQLGKRLAAYSWSERSKMPQLAAKRQCAIEKRITGPWAPAPDS